jgi:2-hydroxychromene-2-carboxylate isomerase
MAETDSRSPSRRRADGQRIDEYRQRAALRLTDAIIPVARQAGLTDDEIVASLADDRVRRNAEKRLGMKERSDATWAYVGQFTADTLRRLNARKGA